MNYKTLKLATTPHQPISSRKDLKVLSYEISKWTDACVPLNDHQAHRLIEVLSFSVQGGSSNLDLFIVFDLELLG